MDIKPGDIILTTQSEPISWMIRWNLHGPWSHAMTVINWPWCISADAQGVTLRQPHPAEMKKYAVLTHPGISDGDRDVIVSFCKLLEGKKYDYLGLFLYGIQQDPNRWYCSEIPFEAYRHVGKLLVARAEYVHPMDLWHSLALEVVESMGI